MKSMDVGDKKFDARQARQSAGRFKKILESRVARSVVVSANGSDNRKRYLKASLTHEKARATVTEAEARGVVRSAAETLASLAHERIIGSNDLRDINYLELAIAVARAICRIRIGSATATGFLVGPRLLMTNNHVLESIDDALVAEAQFDYQENVSGDLLPVHAYRFDPDSFFVTDKTLDFTIVAVAELSAKGQSISRYPWMKLIPTLGKAEKGDPLNIIQHPRGGLKQIALRNNEVIVIPAGQAGLPVLHDRHRAGFVGIALLQRSVGVDRTAPLRRSANGRRQDPQEGLTALEQGRGRSRAHRLDRQRRRARLGYRRRADAAQLEPPHAISGMPLWAGPRPTRSKSSGATVPVPTALANTAGRCRRGQFRFRFVLRSAHDHGHAGKQCAHLRS